MSSIFVRSPYLISKTGTVGQVVQIQLRMYPSGGPIPTLASVTLSKPIPSANVTTVSFNISPYIRDYIEHKVFTEITSATTMLTSEWTKVQVKVILNNILQTTTTYDCLDGFSYRQEGYNVTKSDAYPMMTEGLYYTQDDSCGALYFDTADSTDPYTIQWRNIRTGALQSSTEVEGAGIKAKVPYILPAFYAAGGSVLSIYMTEEPEDILYSFTFVTECSDRYTPIDCDFVNKFGAWQRVTFFKASRSSISVNSNNYNFMSSDVDYDVEIGSVKSLNINGQESIKVNTGLVGENYASVIRELMLSETILLDNLPVTITTKSKDLPTHETVKQINYSLDFVYAYDMINTLGI